MNAKEPNDGAAEADAVRRVAAEVVAAELGRRARAGAVLHDQIAQALVAARMKMAFVQLDPKGAADAITFVVQRIDEALDAVRALTRQLAPPAALDEMPLDQMLRWLARDLGERHGLEVRVHSTALATTPTRAARAALVHALDALAARTRASGATRLDIDALEHSDTVELELATPSAAPDLDDLIERSRWSGLHIARLDGADEPTPRLVLRLATAARTAAEAPPPR